MPPAFKAVRKSASTLRGDSLSVMARTLGIAMRSARSPWRTAMPRSCGWTGREHGDTSQFVGYADGARQRAECWLAASTRIVRVGTHLGNVVKESDYPLPSRCWGNNRRGAAIWIWSKVTVQRS